MAKKVPELSATAVRRLTHGYVKGDPKVKTKRVRNIGDPCTAYHAVGGVAGLLLQVRPTGSKSWVLRVRVGKKRRDIGLGGYPDVTLSQAREKARELREMIRQGIDPVVDRQANRSALIASQKKAVTFADQSKLYVARRAKEFKGRNPAKQVKRLQMHLDKYALPIIGGIIMGDLERKHVLDVLMQIEKGSSVPFWENKHPTADRVRQTIESIYDMAKAEGIASNENPATMKGNLDQTLVKASAIHKTRNQPTVGYERLPAFIELLQKRDATPARALEFQILTAARPGEVQFAEWAEIDLEARLWIVPGHKIKNRKDHTKNHIVPLTSRAIEILKEMPRTGDYIFPGYRGKPHMGENTLNLTVKAVHDMALESGGNGFIDEAFNRVGTAHGMRSSFKDFATEETDFPDDLSELALSHLNSSSTRAAYKRMQMVERRRALMDAYQRYAYSGVLPKEEGGKLVAIG